MPAHPEIMDRATSPTTDKRVFLPSIGLLPEIHDEQRATDRSSGGEQNRLWKLRYDYCGLCFTVAAWLQAD
jgi:hypothetical protein